MARDPDNPDGGTRLSWASSPGIRRSMQSNRGRNTRPEMRVRSALHKAGLRYRTHFRPILGRRCTVDVAFPKDHVALFIDGCYWHSCPAHRSLPKTNREWWATKLNATQDRDRANTAALQNAGWIVLRVWEHENVSDVVDKVKEVLRTVRATRNGRK